MATATGPPRLRIAATSRSCIARASSMCDQTRGTYAAAAAGDRIELLSQQEWLTARTARRLVARRPRRDRQPPVRRPPTMNKVGRRSPQHRSRLRTVGRTGRETGRRPSRSIWVSTNRFARVSRRSSIRKIGSSSADASTSSGEPPYARGSRPSGRSFRQHSVAGRASRFAPSPARAIAA